MKSVTNALNVKKLNGITWVSGTKIITINNSQWQLKGNCQIENIYESKILCNQSNDKEKVY